MLRGLMCCVAPNIFDLIVTKVTPTGHKVIWAS